jgi:hypothetical protein
MQYMTYEQIKAALGPCGLNCEKCFAHVDGDIRQYSLKLKEKLGNFEPYAKRYETLLKEPVFKNYPAFKEMLDYFASENCRGCRNEQCKMFKDCGVRPCHQKKRLISAISVTSSHVTKPTLTKTFIKPGCGSTR